MGHTVFLSFDESKLVSHIKVYENHLNQKIHLIPVSHIGTKEYFQNIVEYVGNEIPCIYENIKLGSEGDTAYKSITNLEDLIEYYNVRYGKIWQEFNSLNKKFYRKYISKEVKEIHKLVQQEVKKSNKQINQIYGLCKKSYFNMIVTYLIQFYWCEIFKLEHQMIAIDYESDIPNRSNWCHGDLNYEAPEDNTNLKETLKNLLSNPTQNLVNELEKEKTIVLGMLLATINFSRKNTYSQRRRELATLLIDSMTTQYLEFENSSPEFLLKMRNVIVEEGISSLLEDFDEIMVFYGAMHMINIEKFLLNEGFKLIKEESFEVFNVVNS